MATAKAICAAEGCSKTARSRGWCLAHYHRWRRYGDPSAREGEQGTVLQWLLAQVTHDGDECLIWPFNKGPKDYARVHYEGRTHSASRVMCLLAHGDPPGPKYQAAHSCGKGVLGCVNPRHLRWDTVVGNNADKMLHGTENIGERQWMAKLNEDAVRRNRDLRGKMTQAAMGNLFGVAPATIGNVLTRRTWAWLD